jgi:competence protein ComEA
MHVDRLKHQPNLVTLIGLIAALVAVIATGLIVSRESQNDVVIIYGQANGDVTVEVRGAVSSPGVVTLPSGSRVGDAIDASGGLTDSADLAEINRARRLDDGELLIIPVTLTQASPIAVAQATTANTDADLQGISYRIDINLASQADLESLPGIGPVIAERIIAFRVQNGAFTEVDQLLEVEGISENLLAEIQTLITIGQ